jgi:hypothetical protein
MTAHTYRTSGSLTEPVNSVGAAREYLRRDDMTQFVRHASFKGLEQVVHHIEWDLLDEASWQVTVVTQRKLTAEESAGLSEWISGQNSDGLGEGFEQQDFAEHSSYSYDEGEDEDFSMSSFDWQTNECPLELVK